MRRLLYLSLLTASIYAQDLGKGNVEVKISGGFIDAGNGPVRVAAPALGIEGAFGLSRFLAVTGGYTHDYLNSASLVTCDPAPLNLPGQTIIPKNCVSAEFQHEFMGGVRISAPNVGRVTPHLEFAVGALKQSSTSSPASFSNGRTEFGFRPGLGADLKIVRHFGISIDANFVKAHHTTGFYHVMGGVYFLF